jgi:uncharacterized protein (DUF2062 family)
VKINFDLKAFKLYNEKGFVWRKFSLAILKNVIHSFLLRRFILPIRQQLVQGFSPRSLALACAMGVAFGAFPIFGLTSALCFIAGLLFRLNQPVLQAVNYLMTPIQLMTIPLFIHFGCVFTQSPLVSIAPQQIIQEFNADRSVFLSKYLWIGLHAVFAWSLIIPWVTLSIYLVTLFIFTRLLRRSTH